MVLRDYAFILRRSWWLIILLPLLAAMFSSWSAPEVPEPTATLSPTPTRTPTPTPTPTPFLGFIYELTYSISFKPFVFPDMQQDPRLGAVQASEYVADDLTQIFPTSRFAEYVQKYVGEDVPVEVISESTRVAKAHRLVIVVLRSKSKSRLERIAEGVKLATQNDLKPLLQEMWDIGEIRIELMDDTGASLEEPDVVLAAAPEEEVPVEPEEEVAVPESDSIYLRIALAFVAAIALAFALDYLDDSIRSREEVEALVGTVLGEIPAKRLPWREQIMSSLPDFLRREKEISD